MLHVVFKAPWSRRLRLTTAVTLVLFALIVLVALVSIEGIPLAGRVALIGLPLLIVSLALLTMVRGYVLTEREIQIKRLGWSTHLPLADLQDAQGNAEAMRGSIRLFGNGGLFSFTGYFWNRRVKKYRAYATDESRAVVLHYPHRTLMVTPHDPQQFIARVRTLIRTRGFPQ